MPCFHYHTLGENDYWRNPDRDNERLDSMNANLVLCQSTSLEPFRVHGPLTLDEYCSPVLSKSVLDNRNRDQVLLKAKKEKYNQERGDQKEDKDEFVASDGRFRHTVPILAVSQIWIWELKDVVIISPSSEASSPLKQEASSPLKQGGFLDLKTYLEKAKSSEDRNRAIGILLSEAISFLEHPADGRDEPVLNFFERYITVVGQKADAYSRMQGRKHIAVDEERGFLHDIDDIRAELAMIKRVIRQQEEVWKSFISNTWREHWRQYSPGEGMRMEITAKKLAKMDIRKHNEFLTIMRPQTRFENYYRRIADLEEEASRVERGILAKLDIKQKHASLQEAHAAGVVSAAVLGFTVITIIFTPLSFVTSLFALSIDKLQRHQVEIETNKVYTTNYIGKWAGKSYRCMNFEYH